jgi:hypothetical protein
MLKSRCLRVILPTGWYFMITAPASIKSSRLDLTFLRSCRLSAKHKHVIYVMSGHDGQELNLKLTPEHRRYSVLLFSVTAYQATLQQFKKMPSPFSGLSLERTVTRHSCLPGVFL